jgi:hypothetical protein
VSEGEHLLRREYGDVVLVDEARLLLHGVGVRLALQLLARQPEHDVLLRVLAAQEVAEHLSPRCTHTHARTSLLTALTTSMSYGL